MKRNSVRILVTLMVLALASAIHAQALSQYKVIYTFLGGTDGETPEAAMIADSAGNLYGITEFGGSQKWGTVFKLAPGAGGVWTETVLYNFSNGTDGGQPQAGLVMDGAGNLYGTTTVGGDPTCGPLHGYCGVVFKLSPNSDGTWSESVLLNFTGSNGLEPFGSLVFDGAGNLYGTTYFGGASGHGTVFELSPNSDGTWTQTILHSFNRGEAGPNSDLVFDSAGNLYGTTNSGGFKSSCAGFGCGTVFELTPQSGGTWSSQILHGFSGKYGGNPVGVVFDASGNLFGAAPAGGLGTCYGLILPGCGTVYELTPESGGLFQSKQVRAFNGKPVGDPNPVIVDSAGNIYGTGRTGGDQSCGFGCGTIYKIAPASGGGWTLTVLYEFSNGTNGFYPYAGLTMDNAGNLYGTAGSGGDLQCESFGGCGVVFQITP